LTGPCYFSTPAHGAQIVMEPQFWNVVSLYLCKASDVTLLVGSSICGETPQRSGVTGQQPEEDADRSC
jgi:hypothetical protein